MKTKAFIINRNLLTWPKEMVKWMNNNPSIEPIIVDNASTYPPLLDWYETDPCRVIRMNVNYGHNVLWTSGLNFKELRTEDSYIVTDPDLDISTVPFDVVDKLQEGLDKHNVPKCGLALRIDDIPDESPNKKQILIWEKPFWENPLGDDYYKAPVDTTFALYRSSYRTPSICGIRLAGPYTCRHLPNYLTPTTVTEEYKYYLEHRIRLAPDDPSFRAFFKGWVDEAVDGKIKL